MTFEAKVIEKGGTRAGAQATLTFYLVSEVRKGAACEECEDERRTAAKIKEEFEGVASELLGLADETNPPFAAFVAGCEEFSDARVAADTARVAWDQLAKQVRNCATQPASKVKRTCLRHIDRVDTANDELKEIERQIERLFYPAKDHLIDLFNAYLQKDRLEMEIDLYTAELKAKCAEDLARLRALKEKAEEALDAQGEREDEILEEQKEIARQSNKLYASYRRLRLSRNATARKLVVCASNSRNFGACTPAVQALIGQDAIVEASIDKLSVANDHVLEALFNLNLQLKQVDNRLEVLVDNYEDALTEYTNCVARLRV
jgi:hypothetical protein